MANLKDSWKDTGKGLGHAFRDLGKTLINSGRVGVEKAAEWAEGDEAPAAAPNAVNTTATETAAGQAPAPEQPQTVSVAEEIRRLAMLKEQGLLTEEEFEAKKRQLLNI